MNYKQILVLALLLAAITVAGCIPFSSARKLIHCREYGEGGARFFRDVYFSFYDDSTYSWSSLVVGQENPIVDSGRVEELSDGGVHLRSLQWEKDLSPIETSNPIGVTYRLDDAWLTVYESYPDSTYSYKYPRR